MINEKINDDEMLPLKERITAYQALANTAQARFNSRRDVEWKVTIALWTIFGAATGAAITARVWEVERWQFISLSLVVARILGLYRNCWLKYLALAFRRDQRTSYYWESVVQCMLKIKLPKHIDPGYTLVDHVFVRRADWVRYEDSFDGNIQISVHISEELHESQKSQFRITLLFAMLFVSVLLGKWLSGPPNITAQV